MALVFVRWASTKGFVPVSNYAFYDAVVQGHQAYHDRITVGEDRTLTFVPSSPPRLKGVVIAGVKVPPKPEEPDNCCQSGCTNCVWGLFTDEAVEWTAKREEAARALAKLGGLWPETIEPPKNLALANMSEALKSKSPSRTQRLRKPTVPVGILAFAAMELSLKKKQL